jgi:hypothetical protein
MGDKMHAWPRPHHSLVLTKYRREEEERREEDIDTHACHTTTPTPYAHTYGHLLTG